MSGYISIVMKVIATHKWVATVVLASKVLCSVEPLPSFSSSNVFRVLALFV